jgi:hypothetical protein
VVADEGFSFECSFFNTHAWLHQRSSEWTLSTGSMPSFLPRTLRLNLKILNLKILDNQLPQSHTFGLSRKLLRDSAQKFRHPIRDRYVAEPGP